MTFSKPPICISCAHLLPKQDNLMSCRAFPIIPGVIVFNELDHRLPVMGDSGIVFEQDPEQPLLDHEAYDAIFRTATADADDT